MIHDYVWHRGRCQISGGYQDAEGKEHGFLLTRGRTTSLDAPRRTDNIAWGINNRGDVVIPEGTVRLAYQVTSD